MMKDTQFSCRDGSWRKINTNWIIWARGSGVARPDPPSTVNPKETSLMTHFDASIRMYDISKNDNNKCYHNDMTIPSNKRKLIIFQNIRS